MRQCATTLESEIPDVEMESLLDALRQQKLEGKHLEIGTAAGGTLCRLNRFYRDDLGRSPPFVVVDPLKYFPQQFDTVCQNLEKHAIEPKEIEFLQSTSKEAFISVAVDPPELDFILVDGNHKIRYVTEDLRWARFLRPGGLLCLHDYTAQFPGVYLSVRRLLRKHPNYKVISQVESLLILQKTSASKHPEISASDRLWAACLGPWFQLKASIAKRLRKSSDQDLPER
jgi:predicted O-methyltransferase YrrM